ncbi:hypothetical protein BCS42_11425 [Crenothrix sp. D3]|nr:hypothetical protein BCS42_11425 [Crenothrix sp. D3]
MTRIFRYASNSCQPLSQNEQHSFAMDHALRLYTANAIYSFIPKNACSTMRLSLALANGCIRDKKDFNWIHANNATFRTDLASVQLAAYTFVILRCPYARLVSVYLSNIVKKYGQYSVTSHPTSFDYFVRELQNNDFRYSDIHWRPQVDFLLYDQYDDYFSLEEFSHAAKYLRGKINLSIVDARNLTKHGMDRFTLMGESGEYAYHSAFSIMQLQYAGQCPSPLALYTDELIAIVKDCYRADIELYKSIFGSKKLMFNP